MQFCNEFVRKSERLSESLWVNACRSINHNCHRRWTCRDAEYICMYIYMYIYMVSCCLWTFFFLFFGWDAAFHTQVSIYWHIVRLELIWVPAPRVFVDTVQTKGVDAVEHFKIHAVYKIRSGKKIDIYLHTLYTPNTQTRTHAQARTRTPRAQGRTTTGWDKWRGEHAGYGCSRK